MKFNKKLIIISMLVMLVCCVSAVSATDINGTDDVSDDIIIDDNAVDEIADIVEDVEIDEVEDDPVEEQQQNPVTTGTINGQPWENYVFNTTGYLKQNVDLTFSGDFYAQPFGNFKVDKSITINAANATFHNIGFDLPVSQITINGGTFIFNESAAVNAVIYDLGSGNTIQNTVMNITAPENDNFYAIYLNQPNGAQILNNVIYYVDNYANPNNYNYIIKVDKGSNVKVVGNNMTAILPMKTVVYNLTRIDRDFVAGVAVTQSNYFNFTGNKMDITGNSRVGLYPTLDAVLIYESNWATIEDNTIIEKDINSTTNQYSYLYGIDVYYCNNLKINNNTVNMNADQSGGQIGGNGTGAAYCIQLTGPHTGVVISNNSLTTKNNGPNLGIYSQNYFGDSQLTIYGNTINVTGKAGNNEWALVSGMELQDTNVTVYNNTVRVNNTSPYAAGNYAFGISYCQYIDNNHYFAIYNNNVEVINGDMAVSLRTGSTGYVMYNTLKTTNYHGDGAVSAPRTDVYVGGNS